jgi:type I restriction enzyme R subunit
VLQITDEVRKDDKVMEQMDKNTKEQALKGHLSSVIQQATVKLMKESNANASVVLSDPDSKAKFDSLIYDMIKNSLSKTFLDEIV